MPFLLAGCGTVATGILLDNARRWTFFQEMPEALILVPALLGLKGNLEMTLASRLSTMVANKMSICSNAGTGYLFRQISVKWKVSQRNLEFFTAT